jgi:hypothetical protein
LSFKPMGNKPMNLSFPRSFTKDFLHKNNWKIMYTYVYTYLVWIGLPSFSPPDEIWYYGKVKPLPIMLGKVPGELVRGKLGDTPNIAGKAKTTPWH